jgi:hypothetical protein
MLSVFVHYVSRRGDTTTFPLSRWPPSVPLSTLESLGPSFDMQALRHDSEACRRVREDQRSSLGAPDLDLKHSILCPYPARRTEGAVKAAGNPDSIAVHDSRDTHPAIGTHEIGLVQSTE